MSNHDLSNTLLTVAAGHVNNKTGIEISFGNHLVDSGYQSTHCISANPSTFNHNSHICESNSKKCKLSYSCSINRIDEDTENCEVKISTQLTPTSTSIRKMSALNLASPKHQQMKSPLKRSSMQTQDEQYTPKKTKIFNENSNSVSKDENGKGRTPFSPISSAKATSSNNINQNKESKFVRQKSLSTSTPKFLRTTDFNIQTIENYRNDYPKSASPRKRKKLFKKFQSFSPISYVKNQQQDKNADQIKKKLKFQIDDKLDDGLKENVKLERHVSTNIKEDSLGAIEEELDMSIDTPRKDVTCENSMDLSIFDESVNKFDDLFNAPIIHTGFEKNCKDVFYDNSNICQKRNNTSNIQHETPKKKQSVSPNSTLCDIFVEDKPSEEISIPSIHEYFDKLKRRSFEQSASISSSSKDDRESRYKSSKSSLFSTTHRDSLELISECYNESDLNKINNSLNTLDSSIILTTPKKINLKNTFEQEKIQILYPEIARTPPKKKKLKRTSPTKQSTLEDRKKISRPTYEGIKRLNILLHLENERPAMDMILNYLPGKDLFNVARVSKVWRNIVENNKNAETRRLEYMKKSYPVKENLKKRKTEEVVSKSKRIPFSQNNTLTRSRYNIELRSPAKSPSKFNENQRFVKRLSKNSTIVKCPRCNYFCEKKTPVPESPSGRRASSKSPRKNLFPTHEYSLRQNIRSMSIPLCSTTLNDFSYHEIRRSNSLFVPKTRQQYLQQRNDISSHNNSKSFNFFDINPQILPRSDGELSDGDSSLPSPIKENKGNCIKCNYDFCTKCFAPYHFSFDCREIGDFSPNKDDEMMKSRNSSLKRSRNKLKRLCY